MNISLADGLLFWLVGAVCGAMISLPLAAWVRKLRRRRKQ